MRRACFSMGSESESLEEGGFIVCMYCSLQENNSFQGDSRDTSTQALGDRMINRH